MTIVFLEYLRKARNEGKLESDKPAYIKLTIEVIIPYLKERFPSPYLD